MIAALTLAAFGPHSDTTLAFPDAMGHTEIVGPSGAGKSLCYDAVCALLFGTTSTGAPLTPALIPDGADKLVLSLTVGRTGSILTRTLTRRGSPTRSLSRNGATETFASDEALRAKLGALAARPELGRIVVAPLVWEALYRKELGRPLRNLLLSLVPGGGELAPAVSSILAAKGLALKTADKLTEAEAEKAQTAANKARDEKKGALNNARTRLAAVPSVAAPDPDALEAARETLAARDAWATYGTASDERASRDARRAAIVARVEAPAPVAPELDTAKAERVFAAKAAWEAYDKARTAYDTKTEARAKALADRTDKQARRAALGERPAVPPAATLTALEGTLARTEPGLADFRKEVEKAQAAVTVAESKAKDLAGASHDCPTCRQAWPARAEAKRAADEALTTARQKLDAEKARLATNESSVQKVRDDIAAHKKAQADAALYDQRLRDIGTDPVIPEPPVEPVKPEGPKPEPNHIAWAEQTRTAAAQADGARKQWEAGVTTARAELAAFEATPPDEEGADEPTVPRPSPADVASAEATVRAASDADASQATRAREEQAVRSAEQAHTEASNEADRVTAVLVAIRQAPSQILRDAVDKLGDLGRVRLSFPPRASAQDPEIVVSVEDERGVVVPWDLASDGLKVAADLDLRAAIRRASGLTALPIFVDRVNLWSGAWPAHPGPIVWLRTEATGAISVRERAAEAA